MVMSLWPHFFGTVTYENLTGNMYIASNFIAVPSNQLTAGPFRQIESESRRKATAGWPLPLPYTSVKLFVYLLSYWATKSDSWPCLYLRLFGGCENNSRLVSLIIYNREQTRADCPPSCQQNSEATAHCRLRPRHLLLNDKLIVLASAVVSDTTPPTRHSRGVRLRKTRRNDVTRCNNIDIWPIMCNYDVIHKPEVHNVSQRCQSRIEPRPQVTCTKIGEDQNVVPHICSRTGRQTHKRHNTMPPHAATPPSQYRHIVTLKAEYDTIR